MSQINRASTKLGPDSIDDLGRAILLLATEVSVLNDRQRVLEAVIEGQGLKVADTVRDYCPTGAFAETLKADRARLARSIVETLCPPAA